MKFDYTPGAKHRIFVRGNLQKDVISGAQQFPGLPPSSTTEDNTKGLAAGDTWTIASNLVNDIRYGYTRQGLGTAGVGVGNYTDVRFIASPTAETRSSIRIVPINTINDNLNYTKGTHSIQIGGTWRLVHNNSLHQRQLLQRRQHQPAGVEHGWPARPFHPPRRNLQPGLRQLLQQLSERVR